MTRDAPDRAPRHRHANKNRALVSTPEETNEGDEGVADASMGEGEYEATPMEAACKMLFGEHEAPRMIQALSAARARERDARARRDDETPETHDETPEMRSRKGSFLDLRRVGPPMVRQSSCQSWDWRDDDESPRESAMGAFRESAFARGDGDASFKRVYSLCNLDAACPRSNDSSAAASRGGSVSGGAAFRGAFGRTLSFPRDGRGGADEPLGLGGGGEDLSGAADRDCDESRGVAKRARLLDARGETRARGARGGAADDGVGASCDGVAGATGPVGRDAARAAGTRRPTLAGSGDPKETFGCDAARATEATEPRPAGGAARARDAARAEPDPGVGPSGTTTRRVSRESEDSAAMRELRREWASMRGARARMTSAETDPTRRSPPEDAARLTGPSGSVSPSSSARAAPSPGEPRRSPPSIEQRLAEALTPTRAPGDGGAWRFNARVTGLNLSNASIGSEGAAFLAEALRPRRNGDGSYAHNTALRSLNLEFNNLGCAGVALIAEAIAPLWVRVPAGAEPGRGGWVANAALERLNLNFCEVGARGAAALAAALAPRRVDGDAGRWRHYGGITHLSLFHNRLGAEGARALAEALAPRAQPDNPAEDPAEAFAFHPTLRSLNVGRNQLGDVGLARIARAFAPVRLRDGSWMYNPTFKHLHANANSCLSQEGPLALSESLAPRQNPDAKWAFAATLTTVHLANVLLGEEGGRALADVFRPRRCEGACFGGHPDGPLGARSKCERHWTFPSNLRVLNLSKTGLGDGGAAHLADALRPRRENDGRWTHNPRLRELHLGGASIGPEGGAALADAIRPRRNGADGDDDALEAATGPRGGCSARGLGAPRWSFNAALQVLDLRDNVLGPEGVAALAGALAPVLDEPEREGSEADGDAGAEASAPSAPSLRARAMETDATDSAFDFGSPTTRARRALAVDAADDRSSMETADPLAAAEEREGEAAERPRRWLFGGALAVLNLEFNDAGAEGVAALARALAPRLCAGPRRPRGAESARADALAAFPFGRGVAGNADRASTPGSGLSPGPTSARVLPPCPHELARDSGSYFSSPGSSLAGSPAATPRGGTSAHGHSPCGAGFPGARPRERWFADASAHLGARSGAGSLPGSAPGSGAPSARSPLAVASGTASGTEDGARGADRRGGGAPDAAAEATAERAEQTRWAANETLRALGVGGNRAGDEGAAALARAVAPRRNPDGSWTSTALRTLDASENAIGSTGLLALAEALDPRRARDDARLVRSVAEGGSDATEGGAADPASRSATPSFDDADAPGGSPSSSRPPSRAVPAAALARSLAATSVTQAPEPLVADPSDFKSTRSGGAASPRAVVGAAVASGGPTPSPAREPASRARAGRASHDARSGLRKLDLARNDSDETVRERFDALRETLRDALGGAACDVIV